MKDTLVAFTRYGIGHAGDEALQLKLAGTWLRMCIENKRYPGAMTFYTDGVRLACEGSPVLEDLAALEREGVHLILCKTCIDALGLADAVRVGVIGGMGDIFAAQATATKVVSL